MSITTIIISILTADIFVVSNFILFDLSPADMWDRLNRLARKTVRSIADGIKSNRGIWAKKERRPMRVTPAIIVIDQRGTFYQLSPRELRELYESFRYPTIEETDGRLYDAASVENDFTTEDLFNAVSVASGMKTADTDRKKAGEVLSHFDGAEMFDQMCMEHEEFSSHFHSLVNEYREAKNGSRI